MEHSIIDRIRNQLDHKLGILWNDVKIEFIHKY